MYEFDTLWNEMAMDVQRALENAEENGSGLQLSEICGINIELYRYNPTFGCKRGERETSMFNDE